MEDASHAAPGTRPFVCPVCESGELEHRGPKSLVRCTDCEANLGDAVLETLRQIVSLPEGPGNHPCECGHPEMRLLPDGVFHCPACRSEVLPLRSVALPADIG